MKFKLFFFVCLSLLGFSSCSENLDEDNEYENWQAKNAVFFASLEDSLAAKPNEWKKLKNWSLREDTITASTDYIYAHVIPSGLETGETTSPYYTDSVRVMYQGRLIPSPSYSEGYVFDSGSVYGKFTPVTGSTVKFLVSGLTDGFATALQHMHRGDYWRIYVPSELGYGVYGTTGVPGYSVLVFDLMLVDFSPAGETMPVWY
jgi:FKBP-type peptidyl-prolyl cis-trans isomerase FklB